MSYIPNAERYNNMQYTRCGNSGILLPKISLGLWHNFGGVDVYENAKNMVLKAFDLGITHFDLANNYGPPPGSAETNFGYILKQELKAYRDELIITSKAEIIFTPHFEPCLRAIRRSSIFNDWSRRSNHNFDQSPHS